MSVSMPVKQRDEEKDLSSSSSDEEEMKRLESAVWKVDENYEKKGTVETNGGHVLPLSKRESLDDSSTFTADFRTVDTTPEFKNFVAKKLVAYLDGILEDLEEPKKRPMKYEQPIEDSFQLFSTSSKSYVPQKINYPQPKWKREQQKRRRQGKESSSSSDSEEEKKKLEAAAVSGDFILGGAKRTSSSHQEGTENGEEEPSRQVTSNPDCSVLTHNAPHLDNDSVENIFHKKKKKKTPKEDNFELVRSSCEGSYEVTTSGNDIARTSKKKKKKRKKEKILLGDVSQNVANIDRLNDDQVEETAPFEKVSNVTDPVETSMVYSNNTVEHEGTEHSSNCKKKKKRKRKKELENA